MIDVKNNLRGVIGPRFGVGKADIDATSLTDSRIFTLPNSGGEIALTGHSHDYSTLSGRPTLGTAAALDVGTISNKIVQLDANAKLPAVDGSQLLHLIDQIARDAALAAKRMALTAIAMAKSTGGLWGSIFGDEFTDETRISSKTGATFATGYYYNPSSSGTNLAPGNTAISGGDYSGFPVSRINDNSTSNQWVSSQLGPAVANAAYAGVDLGNNRDIVRMGLWLNAESTTPSSAKIQYSDNGSSWNDASTISPQGTYGQFVYFTFTSVGSHRYWRIFAVSEVSSGQGFQIYEMSLSEADSPSSSMTLISTAVSELRGGTVKNMVLGLEYEPVDSIAVGTDLKLYASRDNGSTWAEATYDPAMPFLSGKTMLSAMANVTSQPAGTSLKWKLTTHNNKQLKIHGITVFPSME